MTLLICAPMYSFRSFNSFIPSNSTCRRLKKQTEHISALLKMRPIIRGDLLVTSAGISHGFRSDFTGQEQQHEFSLQINWKLWYLQNPTHYVCEGLFSRQAYVVLISIVVFSTQKTNTKEKCHHILLLKLSKKAQSLDYERL